MQIKMDEPSNGRSTKAFQQDEVPIGAIIVKDNKIISSAHNQKEQNKIATHHAEILAINEVCKN